MLRVHFKDKNPGSWRCNEIKLVVASHPNKPQPFNAPCALSPNLLYANSFHLRRPAIPPLDAVRTKSGFYSDSVGFFIFQDFWRLSLRRWSHHQSPYFDKEMIGQTLNELDLRNTYNLTAIMHKKIGEQARIIRNSNTALEAGDEITVIGDEEDIKKAFG